ncbi:hypothetical protein GCM10022248_89680 [Nonomuraea soli]
MERARELTGIAARLGDARQLPVPDESADVALLLGPFYHLTERADRVGAPLAEESPRLSPAPDGDAPGR